MQSIVSGNLVATKQMHRGKEVREVVWEDQWELTVNVFPDRESDERIGKRMTKIKAAEANVPSPFAYFLGQTPKYPEPNQQHIFSGPFCMVNTKDFQTSKPSEKFLEKP